MVKGFVLRSEIKDTVHPVREGKAAGTQNSWSCCIFHQETKQGLSTAIQFPFSICVVQDPSQGTALSATGGSSHRDQQNQITHHRHARSKA